MQSVIADNKQRFSLDGRNVNSSIEVATADLGDRASKVTVDLTLAGDWTDKHAPE